MPIYLTEYTDRHGRRRCGPDLDASSLQEAEAILSSMRIVGVLVERIDAFTGERTLYPEVD
jgi:hypothetical protein